MRELAALPDPVGEIEDGRRLPNGIELTRVRVPLGVVAVVYEARPNVTVDAAASLPEVGQRRRAARRQRGEALQPHAGRGRAGRGARSGAAAPRRCTFIAGPREALLEVVALKGLIDVVIPRGGEELKELLTEHSRVPVIAAAGGNCHVYVDAAADLAMALAITVNAKCQRPGVCNSAETLLVHRDVAARFLPDVVAELTRRGVELVVDRSTAELVPDQSAQARQPHPLRDRVPRPQDGGARGRVDRRGHRPHRHLRQRPLRGDRHRRPRRPPRASPARSTPPRST